MKLDRLIDTEERRNREFPVTGERIFMAHAGVSPLPRCVLEALREFLEQGSRDHQESGLTMARIDEARSAAAGLLGCHPAEVALLGPTSLGLNLVANGLEWNAGDEVICYADDYPANVYPWTKLRSRGVRPVTLAPDAPGRIDWELVEGALTERTRLVALASCHFLSGFRIDLDGIGRNLRERGVLFCVDGIQSLGAFPLSVRYVDFLSADSHKWLLGPLGAGVFYVREEHHERLTPSLLGAWNVRSPDFVAQREIRYYDGARRYEPGALNVPGIIGMLGAMRMLLELGVGEIAARILGLRKRIIEGVMERGFRLCGGSPGAGEEEGASGITSITGGETGMENLFRRLREQKIDLSLRRNRSGETFLRISPHFYNTFDEVDILLEALSR